MLRRQGLPPSCPHPEKWLVPVELPVSLLPGVQDEWDSQTLGICVLCRGNVAVEGIKDGNHFPLLEISLQLRRSRSCGSPGPIQRAVSKRPGTGRAFEPYGSRAPQISPGGQRDSRPLAAGGASFFTPRAAAIPPQAGYLRSVPQAGNAASGRSHTCTRPDSRDPRSRPRGPHAADSAP